MLGGLFKLAGRGIGKGVGSLTRVAAAHPFQSALFGFMGYSTTMGLVDAWKNEPPAVANIQTWTTALSTASMFLPPPIGFIAPFAIDAIGEWQAKVARVQTAYGMGRDKFHYSPVPTNERTMASINRGMAKMQSTQQSYMMAGRNRAFGVHSRYSMGM